MAEEATHFYFTHYRQHWCSSHLAEALACIPQVMMWDDHDIFDGWGSYPHALLTCSVFQGDNLPFQSRNVCFDSKNVIPKVEI